MPMTPKEEKTEWEREFLARLLGHAAPTNAVGELQRKLSESFREGFVLDEEDRGDAYDRGYKQAASDWAERCAYEFKAGTVWGAAIVAMGQALRNRERFRCLDCGEVGQPVEHDPYTVCKDYDACTETIQRKQEAQIPDEGDW